MFNIFVNTVRSTRLITAPILRSRCENIGVSFVSNSLLSSEANVFIVV